MTAGEEAVMRAAVALQVAVIEHMHEDPRIAYRAMRECANELSAALSCIYREDRLAGHYTPTKENQL